MPAPTIRDADTDAGDVEAIAGLLGELGCPITVEYTRCSCHWCYLGLRVMCWSGPRKEAAMSDSTSSRAQAVPGIAEVTEREPRAPTV